MRVLAAFSQCVSSERFFSILTSEVFPTLLHGKPLSYGFYFDIDRHQGQFLAAFRAFSIILLEDFIRRLEFCPFI